jgi:hypothetical protein
MEFVNILFSMIFTIEMIIKLLGLRLLYFKDKWNIFDFLIVLASWFDFLARFH